MSAILTDYDRRQIAKTCRSLDQPTDPAAAKRAYNRRYKRTRKAPTDKAPRAASYDAYAWSPCDQPDEVRGIRTPRCYCIAYCRQTGASCDGWRSYQPHTTRLDKRKALLLRRQHLRVGE